MRVNDYLAELDGQLRARRAPRARLLKEVEDHLADLADELVADGLDAAEAKAQAVARFGAAAVVAARFAAATATTSAHRAVELAAISVGAYAAVFVFFASDASPLLRDFPQGATSFFTLQLATVALLVAAVRSLRWRSEVAAPAAALSALARALALTTGALFVAALAEAAVALTRPAGVVAWTEGRWLVVAFGASLFVLGAAVVVHARAAAQAHAVRAFPGDAATATETPVADDIDALAARWRLPNLVGRSALALSRHAWPATLLLAAAAFLIVTAAGVASGGGAHASRLGGAATLGLLEAAAIVAGFACCGRLLSLRTHSTA
jgi:hypothetical protein